MDSNSLSLEELTIVMDTLTKRRAWILQSLEDGEIEANNRDEHIVMEQLLHQAMKKLHAQRRRTLLTTSTDTRLSVVSRQNQEGMSLDKVRVLVAEDDQVSAQILVAVIKEAGIENVDVAMNGHEAFDKIRAEKTGYDIIFCDWDMPEVSGLELHQRAKLANILRDAYFCMVTSMAETKMIREAIKVGVNDYIVKPVDTEMLDMKIKSILQNKNTGR